MGQPPVFRRFHLALTVAVSGLILLSGAGIARADGPQSPSEQYLALRHANEPRPGLTPRKLAENAEAYRGAVLELSGRLTGIVRKDTDGAILMLATEDYPCLTLSMSELPDWVQPGTRLRVLAVAVTPEEAAGEEGQTVVLGIPDMKVVAVASAADIDAAEERWRQTAAARAAREKQTQAALKAADAALVAKPGAKSVNRRVASRQSRSTLASRGGSYSGSASSGATVTPIRPGAPLYTYLSPAAKQVYETYLAYIRKCNRRLSVSQADAITSSILLFSERYAVDPRLVIALIIAESDFHIKETSNKGAMGLGQLMPDEVHDLGLNNPYDPTQNIAGAIYLLRGRLDNYRGGGDLTMQHVILALASYNAGMGAVKKYGGVPPYRETQNYVKKIERIYRQLCGVS